MRKILFVLMLAACTEIGGPADENGVQRWTANGYQYARKDGVTCVAIEYYVNGKTLYQWLEAVGAGNEPRPCPFASLLPRTS